MVNGGLTAVMAIGRTSAGDSWASPYEAKERGFLFVEEGKNAGNMFATT